MARLESSDVDRVLRGKMQAERKDKADWYYVVRNKEGIAISSTSISKGSKETLRDNRVRDMARQLGLDGSQQLVEFVGCTLSRDDAIKIIEKNRPPGTPRQNR